MASATQKGFTLIELMIALVILAIISTIAATTFSGSGKDAERSRIISELAALNDAAGRYYQGSYSYADMDEALLRSSGGGTAIAASPSYDVEVTVDDDNQGYVIVARPLAGGEMQGEGAYSVDEDGRRCYFPGDDVGSPPEEGANCDKNW